MAGNETNFFVRDVTNGSKLPLRIRPNANSNSIFVDTDSDVGLGTSAPAAAFHLRRTDGSAELRVEEANGIAALRTLMRLMNNGGIQFLLDRTDGQNDWQISNFGANFQVSVPGSSPAQMNLNQNGNMTIGGTQYLTGSSVSSRRTSARSTAATSSTGWRQCR